MNRYLTKHVMGAKETALDVSRRKTEIWNAPPDVIEV